MRRFPLLLACMVMAIAAAAGATEAPRGYTVRQSLELDPRIHGMRGTVQLIQDARLGDTASSSHVWGGDDGAPGLRGVQLRLLDGSGLVVDEQLFESPIATLETVDLHGGGRPTFLVRVDYGTGVGRYYGLATFLLEVRNGRLRRLMAVDESGSDTPGDDDRAPGRTEPIVLMSALRSGWVLVRDGEGPGKAILAARSRPHLEDDRVREGFSGESVVLFHTYRYQNGQWRRWERRMIGEWEDGGEDSWPDRRLFP